MTQLIIVYAVGVLLFAYLAYKVYRIFFRKGYKNLCHNCPAAKDCNNTKAVDDSCHCNGQPD